jgi:HEAT repeat protein
VSLGREPLVTVRARCLDVLVREYPDLRVTRRALRTALGDSTLEVRVQAAKALGDEGEPTLRAIASAEDGPDDIQARAIRALGERLSPELGESILHGALRRRRLPIAEACLEALGRHRKDDIVGPLAKVLAIERGALAAAAARALGTTGRPGAEAPLIDALGRLEGSAKLEAAVALGRVASAAAVAPLRRLERASRDAALRRAAREAIAQIQERLSGASPGQLSLADREVGQLSLTEDEAGRVSLSEEDGSAAEGDDHTRHRD